MAKYLVNMSDGTTGGVDHIVKADHVSVTFDGQFLGFENGEGVDAELVALFPADRINSVTRLPKSAQIKCRTAS